MKFQISCVRRTYHRTTNGAGRLIKENLQSVYDKGSIHFGQPYLNTATMAELYRMMLKHLAETLGVCFPAAAADEGKPRTPWRSSTYCS